MNTETETTNTPPTQPPTATIRPTVAAVVVHEVSDYDAWKLVFDQHAKTRREAGIIRHHINRSADNPNLLSIYLAGTDRAKLQAFFDSEDLESTMMKAGVTSAPTITLIEPLEDQTDKRAGLYGMIVIHPVEDFDAWKAVYDEVEPLRQQAGIVGHAVNRSADDSNQVVVYHQAESLEALHAFADSDELKAAMKRAGVSGPPSFSYHQSAGWGN